MKRTSTAINDSPSIPSAKRSNEAAAAELADKLKYFDTLAEEMKIILDDSPCGVKTFPCSYNRSGFSNIYYNFMLKEKWYNNLNNCLNV